MIPSSLRGLDQETQPVLASTSPSVKRDHVSTCLIGLPGGVNEFRPIKPCYHAWRVVGAVYMLCQQMDKIIATSLQSFIALGVNPRLQSINMTNETLAGLTPHLPPRDMLSGGPRRYLHLEPVTRNLYGKRVFFVDHVVMLRIWSRDHPGSSRWALNPTSNVLTIERQREM